MMYHHNHESDKYTAVNNTWKHFILRIIMLSYTAPMFQKRVFKVRWLPYMDINIK